MNHEAKPGDQDFTKLKQLLAAKRHEQPPPGYFDRLPGQIMAKIERAEAEKARPWWERWFNLPLSKPAVASMYAAMAMTLFLGAAVVGHVFKSGKQAHAVDPVEKPLPAAMAADTNGTSRPPAFLVQPGTVLPNGESRETNTLPAGFKQQ